MTKNRTTTIPSKTTSVKYENYTKKHLANGLEPRYNGDVQIPCHRIF